MGLIYGVVPVLGEGRLVALVTLCGLRAEGEVPDPFLAAQQLGVGEDEALCRDVGAIPREEVEELLARLADELGG